MEIAAIIAAVNAGLNLVNVLAPQLRDALSKGEVSAEDQAKLRDEFDKLRNSEAFTGPEWEPSGR